MRVFFLFLIFFSLLYPARVVESRWLEGQVFSQYLEDRKVPLGLINTIDESDKQFLSEIQEGEKFLELFDKNGDLLQALIPVGDEMQILIAKENKNSNYSFDIIPIEFTSKEHKVITKITSNPYDDIKNATNNSQLANEANLFIKEYIDTRKLHKNDAIALIYKQNERLLKPFGSASITIAMIETGGKKLYIYADEEGEPFVEGIKTVTFDSKGNKITKEQIRKIKEQSAFGMPIRHVRISSNFSYKRWHPILHRYRPHLGVDFAARRGTPLLAVNSGRVIFAGWQGGYGKVVKIRHRGGYVSLYGHQSSIKVKSGDMVDKGDIIGYVGNTGRSTGPHLHFGLYKNQRAINPLLVLKKNSAGFESFITKKITIIGDKKEKAKIEKILISPQKIHKWDDYNLNYTLLNEKNKYI